MLFSKRSNVSKVEKERIEYSFVRNTEKKARVFSRNRVWVSHVILSSHIERKGPERGRCMWQTLVPLGNLLVKFYNHSTEATLSL